MTMTMRAMAPPTYVTTRHPPMAPCRAPRRLLLLICLLLLTTTLLYSTPVSSSSSSAWTFGHPSNRMEWTRLYEIDWDVRNNDDNKKTVQTESSLNDEYDLVVLCVPNNITNATELYQWYVAEHTGDTLNDAPRDTAFARYLTSHEQDVDLETLVSEKSRIMRIQSNHTTTRLCVVSIMRTTTTTTNSPDESNIGSTTTTTFDSATHQQRQQAGRELGMSLASLFKGDAKSVGSVAVVVPPSFQGHAECATSLLSALYVDKRYKGISTTSGSRTHGRKTGTDGLSKDEPSLKKLHFWQSPASSKPGMTFESTRKQLDHAIHLAKGIYLTKDIVQAPHNILNSHALAETAQRLARESKGKLKCRILELKDCEKRKMGAFLGVARGSETLPKFIHLTYRGKRLPGQRARTKVGIVGKGLLFDTGGYNIKTAMMELMKFDCGGAAAVLGAARCSSTPPTGRRRGTHGCGCLRKYDQRTCHRPWRRTNGIEWEDD